MDIPNDVIKRWGVVDNVTEEIHGNDADGTTVDFDEPFVIM